MQWSLGSEVVVILFYNSPKFRRHQTLGYIGGSGEMFSPRTPIISLLHSVRQFVEVMSVNVSHCYLS